MQKEPNRHLRIEDRQIIYRMSKAGKTQKQIALVLGINQSSVSRELSRNRGQKGYRPKQANEKAQLRQATKKKREPVVVGYVEEQVLERLSKKHSPEQISLRLKKEGASVSHESIYRYILEDKCNGGTLYKQLRINGKRRYRRRCKASRTKIPDRVGIEKRPKVVEKRARYGDWEADLIEGTKGSGFILSLYERKTHYGKICKLETKSAEVTAAAIVKQLAGYKVKTIPYDNGLEFSGHKKVSQLLNAQGYFCQPYHSWEKGGVENYNGLVRQYLPKGTSFDQLQEDKLQTIETEINERPRKTLNILSPSQLEHKIAA